MRTLFLSLALGAAAVAGDLKAEFEALRAPGAPWRAVAWRTCLLEALAEARAEKKPVLCWIFIDRPVDDARC